MEEKKDLLFSIQNLVCSYDGVHPVLFVPRLDIPAGEICVLFGKSGSGKSTLLETLGLMTNTLAMSCIPYMVLQESEKRMFSAHDYARLEFGGGGPELEPLLIAPLAEMLKIRIGGEGKSQYRVKSIWEDNKLQQELRQKHFAFIFQDTNLMPNFSAEENVALPEMVGLEKIRCGGNPDLCPFEKSLMRTCRLTIEDCCLVHARSTLKRVGIVENKFNVPVKELSGGQKQRIAFARAINAGFSVVFGDEPTGNLDQQNSELLMDNFRLALKTKKGKDSSAILVSHSIQLTLDHADRILLIDLKKYKISDMDSIRGMVGEKFLDNGTENVYGKIEPDKFFVSELKGGEGNINRQWYLVQEGAERIPFSNDEIGKYLADHLKDQ